MTRRRILFFTFLNTPEMALLGNRLADSLEERHEAEVVFVSPFDIPGLDHDVIRIPLLIRPFQQFCSESSGPEELSPELVREVVEADQAFHEDGSRSFEEHLRGLASAHYYYSQMLMVMNPSLVLVWGSSLPHNPLLSTLAVRWGAACREVERGFYPGTFMVKPFPWPDGSGIYASEWYFEPEPADDVDRYEAIRKHYLETRPFKYPQGDFVGRSEYLERAGIAGKKVYVLLSHNDIYAGVYPRSRSLSRIVSPRFASVRESLSFCLEAIRPDDDSVLVFKSHPMDHVDYSGLADSRLVPAREEHLHTLCSAADVIIADTTTAQYEALLFEKPLVSLSNNYLRGKDIAYEVGEEAEGAGILRAALRRERFETKRANARRFVRAAFDRMLYTPDAAMPFGRSVDAFADELARLCEPKDA